MRSGCAVRPAVDGLDAVRTSHNTWFAAGIPGLAGRSIAYFSAEFALHQSLPIYAGGLGVLAGDHCKEASDLGLPLIGVGFMYPQGYFHQGISPDGWQQELRKAELDRRPIEPALTPDGKPCVTAVPLGNRTVLVAVWRVRIGRVKLYLLDTDLEENAPWDRELSARLYGGDRETRVQQEIILGIGGVRALQGDRRRRRPCITSTKGMPRSSCCSGFAISARKGGRSTRRSRKCGERRCSPRTRRWRPGTTLSRSISSKGTSPAAWGDLGAYRERSWPSAHYDNGGGPLFNMTALALRAAAR